MAGAAAIAIIAAAPIASAAPSEQQCLQQHCLAADAPTISQRPGNVQIVTSPKDLPAVFPHTNDPNWSGLGYDARWNGFQTARLPAPGIREGGQPLVDRWTLFQHSRALAALAGIRSGFQCLRFPGGFPIRCCNPFEPGFEIINEQRNMH